jgi:hypothetical protein
MTCSVHIYKWSQDTRRKKLKKLAKQGHLKFLYRTKTHFHYEILNMKEYCKMKGN